MGTRTGAFTRSCLSFARSRRSFPTAYGTEAAGHWTILAQKRKRKRRTLFETGDVPTSESYANFVKLCRCSTSGFIVLVDLRVTHFYAQSRSFTFVVKKVWTRRTSLSGRVRVLRVVGTVGTYSNKAGMCCKASTPNNNIIYSSHRGRPKEPCSNSDRVVKFEKRL